MEREEQIRERAFQLWDEAGRPEGQDLDYWLQAENQLQGEAPESNDKLREMAALANAKENVEMSAQPAKVAAQ